MSDRDIYYLDFPKQLIGRVNPSWACQYCSRADPTITGRLDGHTPDCKYRLEKEAELAAAPALKAQEDEEIRRQACKEMELAPDTMHVTCAEHGCTAPVLDVYRSMNWVFDDDGKLVCDPFYPTCFEADTES